MSDDASRSGAWFHPLIAPASGRLDRRRMLIAGGIGSVAALSGGPHLRLVAAQDSNATPAPSGLTGDDDAIAILSEAAATMAALESFRFEIETVQGESTILGAFSVESIEGAVRRPFDFSAAVMIGLPFGSIEVTAVGVEGAAWLQNPLDPDDWIPLDDFSGVVALVNPDSLILASIGLIQDARIDGQERVGGMETIRLTGIIDFVATAGLMGATESDLPAEIATEPLDVVIWIDEEHRVLEIEVTGPILTSESDDVTRAIRFLDFNEPVEIEAPAT